MKEVYLHREDFKLLQPVTSRISGMTPSKIDSTNALQWHMTESFRYPSARIRLSSADCLDNLQTFQTIQTLHYGFSYNISGNGTFCSSNSYFDFNFHQNLLKPFLHDRQLPKDYAKYFFDQIWPIFAEIFAKNMKRSPANSEILCVNQIDRDLKKK